MSEKSQLIAIAIRASATVAIVYIFFGAKRK